jgi:hypothetical protein
MSLRCFAEVALGAEEERGVIERSTLALDNAHNEMDGMLARGGCDPVDVRSGHVDRAIEVASELSATLWRTLPDDRSEADASRVARDPRFREYGQLRPASGRFGDQPVELVHRLLSVEPDRGGLDDGSLHAHRGNHISTGGVDPLRGRWRKGRAKPASSASQNTWRREPCKNPNSAGQALWVHTRQ